jgi:Na+/melibiose symporter-like transporter
LIIALFLWDTMYTFVGLAMCSLFTELSQEPEDRISLTRYAQIASLLGSSSVMPTKFLFFMPIGNPRWPPLKIVEDHPMNIHVQFGFNHICSF